MIAPPCIKYVYFEAFEEIIILTRIKCTISQSQLEENCVSII